MHALTVYTLTEWKQRKWNSPTWKLWVSSEGHLALGRPLYTWCLKHLEVGTLVGITDVSMMHWTGTLSPIFMTFQPSEPTF